MTILIACDASFVVAALTATDHIGHWARTAIAGAVLLAPAHMPVEVANVLRRGEASGEIPSGRAQEAHRDLIGMDVDLWSHALLGRRAWELRHNLTIYDACYVAVAEVTGTELLTLDRRIGRAPGVRCLVRTPPD